MESKLVNSRAISFNTHYRRWEFRDNYKTIMTKTSATIVVHIITSWDDGVSRIPGLFGKASKAEYWCFLWLEQAVEQKVTVPLNPDAMALTWRYCNDLEFFRYTDGIIPTKIAHKQYYTCFWNMYGYHYKSTWELRPFAMIKITYNIIIIGWILKNEIYNYREQYDFSTM